MSNAANHTLRNRATVTLLIAAVAALVAVAPGFAGKGGSKGSNGSTSTTAWVSATPNPASVGDHVSISACGYYPYDVASVTITRPDGTTVSGFVGMWGTGCIDTGYFTASEAGTYVIRVSQGNTGASTTVSVS